MGLLQAGIGYPKAARTFEWDARNQLVAVTVGTHRSEFSYDGEQRRVRIVEKEGGVTQSDTRIGWCDEQICEERAADGATVTRRPFERGEQIAGALRIFATDHLGSVTEVTDASAALLGRYAFDPWGRRTLEGGLDVTGTGFTGHRAQESAGLLLTPYRAYDAGLGRWISEDPMGFGDGPNAYLYVQHRTSALLDPLGLQAAANSCCDGKGGFTVCWNQSIPNATLRSCLEEHELDHVAFMEHPCRNQQCVNRRRVTGRVP